MKREYPEAPIVAVAALIYNKRGEILLVRRRAEPGKGLWSIPGGAVETGEKLIDALKREVLEETGLDIKPIDIIDIFEVIKRDEYNRIKYHYIIIDYIAEALSRDLNPSTDVSDAVWIKIDEVTKYKITKSLQKMLERNMDKILRHLKIDGAIG